MTRYEQQYKRLCEQCCSMQEHNACSVLALAAVAGCDFVTAYISLANHGRKPGQGTTMTNVLNALERDFGITMECWPIDKEASAKDALDKYVSHADTGIVEVEEHVFAFKDGMAIDTPTNMARRPMYLFRIEKSRGNRQ